jgi:hypothetical protein
MASIIERFWSKVDKDGPTAPGMATPCWLWTAAIGKNGYGAFNRGRRGEGMVGAHVYAYGPVPAGLELDHLCRNRV